MRIIAVLIASLVLKSIQAQTQTEKIALFCQVWGFLKYHHPNVAGGSINWDSVFITHIRDIVGVKDSVQLNTAFSALIEAAGPDENADTARLEGDVFTKNHDLRWFSSPWLSEQVRNKLQYIYTHRNRGANRFVKFNNYTDYSGEAAYAQMTWPTKEYRLLFFARFWNAIDYYDPYKFMAAQDWNDVLLKYIPKVMLVKDTTAYHKILLELAVVLHDGHARLETDDDIWGSFTLPVYITILNDTVVINRTADDSLCRKIQKGDILLAINGEPLTDRIARFKPYTTSSNQVSLNRHLEIILLNTRDTVQQVTIRRGSKKFTTEVKTIPAAKRSWTYINNYTAGETGYKTIGDSIAYVYTMQIGSGNVDTIKALIRSKRAVIFDARSYTQDDAFYNIFDMFLPRPVPINYATMIMPDDPGYFSWQLSPKLGNINAAPYSGKVVILADERCQSQGEYSVMTLQTIPNSVTIGSQTCGLDGVVSSIPMGGGLAITHSGYGIYYPDKSPTQQCGVRIDIKVRKTVGNILRDEDPALTAAISYLKGEGIR